jgi:hypothetical protein
VSTGERLGAQAGIGEADCSRGGAVNPRILRKSQIFDHPFSTEIIRVSASGLFAVLDTVFDKSQLAAFKKGFDDAKRTKDAAQRVQIFKGLARKFAEGAAKAAGGGVVTVVKAHLGSP